MTTMLDQNLGATDVAELVRRAAEGDQEAWERLIDQYSRLIWSITVDFKLPESDAADVVQTTWLRLLEHIDRIEHPARVGSWLAATARNACLRSLATQKRLVLGHEDTDLEDATRHEPEIDEHLLASERAQTVQDAVPACPGGGNGCSNCSWPIHRLLTSRSRINSVSRSGASALPAAGAWRDYACC